MSGPQDKPSGRGGKKWLVLGAAVMLVATVGVVMQRSGRETGQEKQPAAFEPGVLELEPFTLNLADPSGDRYFRIAVRLVLDQREIAERAGSGLGHVKLRDRILSVLASKRARDMTSQEGKDRLRAEILEASEALLAHPPFHDGKPGARPARVADVFFTEFLVQ